MTDDALLAHLPSGTQTEDFCHCPPRTRTDCLLRIVTRRLQCETAGVFDADSRLSLLEGAADATLVVDWNGVIRYANRRTFEVLGWQPSELVGQPVEVLVPESVRSVHTKHRSEYAHMPRPRMMGYGLELTAVHRDGHTVPVEIALSPQATEEERLIVVSIRDISERVSMIRQLGETAAKLAVVDERDRIARDLHDNIVQRLFAAGLHLQAALGRPDQEQRLVRVIDEIDDAIKEIRTIIFTMHSLRGLDAGFEPAVRLVLAESSRLLGHHPSLQQDGVLALVGDDLASEAVDVVRELLTNVAKHARASHSSVRLSVADQQFTIAVTDNGVGIDPTANPGGLGLQNLRQRAELRSGCFDITPSADGGSTATWSVPLL